MILHESLFERNNDMLKMNRHKSMILPKDLVPCDFDEKLNLLEVEDRTDGSRTWIEFSKLPRLNYKVGCEYLMNNCDGSTSPVIFTRIESIVHRKRHYLSPVFTLSEEENDGLPF